MCKQSVFLNRNRCQKHLEQVIPTERTLERRLALAAAQRECNLPFFTAGGAERSTIQVMPVPENVVSTLSFHALHVPLLLSVPTCTLHRMDLPERCYAPSYIGEFVGSHSKGCCAS